MWKPLVGGPNSVQDKNGNTVKCHVVNKKLASFATMHNFCGKFWDCLAQMMFKTIYIFCYQEILNPLLLLKYLQNTTNVIFSCAMGNTLFKRSLGRILKTCIFNKCTDVINQNFIFHELCTGCRLQVRLVWYNAFLTHQWVLSLNSSE